MDEYIGRELKEKLANPLVFQRMSAAASRRCLMSQYQTNLRLMDSMGFADTIPTAM